MKKTLAVAALALLMAGPAMAGQKSAPVEVAAAPKIGGPVGHALDVIQGQPQGSNEGGGIGGGSQSGNVTLCDATMMSKLQLSNIIQQIKVCKAADADAALASATAKQDSVAISCLTPLADLFHAVEGTLPTAAPAAPGTTATTSAPTVLLPAGPLLIFEKIHEFGRAGGVAHCKSYINTTITDLNPLQ